MTDLTTYEQQLARLGEAIAVEGAGRYEPELAAVANRARRASVALDAADVLVDRSAPGVVRERAFAVVCLALASTAGTREPIGELARTAA